MKPRMREEYKQSNGKDGDEESERRDREEKRGFRERRRTMTRLRR